MALVGPSKAARRQLQGVAVVALVVRKGLPVWGLSPGWTRPLLP